MQALLVRLHRGCNELVMQLLNGKDSDDLGVCSEAQGPPRFSLLRVVSGCDSR